MNWENLFGNLKQKLLLKEFVINLVIKMYLGLLKKTFWHLEIEIHFLTVDACMSSNISIVISILKKARRFATVL
jgi:hypothetical protein